MTKLYACIGSGNCFKPWLALNQLDQPFELELIDVLKGQQKSADYLGINPLGVVPFLKTERGLGLGESNAMLWYLAEGDYLMPASPEARAEALQWMFFEQSKLEPFISPARFFTTILPGERAKRADDIASWQEKARSGLDRLESHLARQAFMVAGRYSVADIAVFGYVHVMDEAGLAFGEYPAIARWVEAVKATEGFRPLSEMGATALAAE
ncbi:MAG: glutathione S-transferase family protein [Pseudomonadota bacterium]